MVWLGVVGWRDLESVIPKSPFVPLRPSLIAKLLWPIRALWEIFSAKLGALYGRLNLIAKPMQVFNIDETGISIVHKPGKVICDLGRKRVFAY